jgi:hypothetical protein
MQMEDINPITTEEQISVSRKLAWSITYVRIHLIPFDRAVFLITFQNSVRVLGGSNVRGRTLISILASFYATGHASTGTSAPSIVCRCRCWTKWIFGVISLGNPEPAVSGIPRSPGLRGRRHVRGALDGIYYSSCAGLLEEELDMYLSGLLCRAIHCWRA